MEKGLHRRHFLEVGLAGLAAMATPAIASTKRDTKLPLVVLFNGGAQSPYEFTSPLVDSVSEYRGPVGSINSAVGPIGEHWEEFASVAKHAAVVRSVDAQNTSHTAKHLFPDGSLERHGQRLASGGIPYVFYDAPSNFSDLSGIKPGFRVNWDGKQKRFTPPPIVPDPNLRKRVKLLEQLDRFPTDSPAVALMQKNRELATSLLLGGDALTRPFVEAEKHYERYGDNPVGKGAALAAEFAKSGAGVTVFYNEFGPGWDLHSGIKEGTDKIALPTDLALKELILDARRFGFVVVCLSEHGRTPRVNSSAGRDHHNVSFMVGAGGKFRPEATYGSVDKYGEIADNPIKADQLIHTIRHACGEEVERTKTINPIVT